MKKITIDSIRCSGCGRCIAVCRVRCFQFETTSHRKRSVVVDSERCTFCMECIKECPLLIIKIQENESV